MDVLTGIIKQYPFYYINRHKWGGGGGDGPRPPPLSSAYEIRFIDQQDLAT